MKNQYTKEQLEEIKELIIKSAHLSDLYAMSMEGICKEPISLSSWMTNIGFDIVDDDLEVYDNSEFYEQ